MKIELITKAESLLIISATLQPIYKSKSRTRREKSTLSIAFDVAKKIESKAFTLKGQQNMFDQKKNIKISLKHHEADMLELLLIDQIKSINDDFIKNKIQQVIDQLNQKLA